MLNDCIGFSVITRNYSEQQEASFIMADESEKKRSWISTYYIVLCGDTEVSQLSAVYLLMFSFLSEVDSEIYIVPKFA